MNIDFQTENLFYVNSSLQVYQSAEQRDNTITIVSWNNSILSFFLVSSQVQVGQFHCARCK